MQSGTEILNLGGVLFRSHIHDDMHCEHRMQGHILMFVRSGKLVLENPDEHAEVNAGGYVFIKRDCTATMRKMSIGATPFASLAISLPRAMLKEYYSTRVTPRSLPRAARPLGSVAEQLPATAALQTLFRKLDHATMQPQEGYDYNRDPEGLLRRFVSEAVSALLEINSRFYPTLFDFQETWKIDLLEFMEKHYMEDISLSEFASYTGRSLATFKRDFAKVSMLSPRRWIVEHRLNLARQLMHERGMRASDVYAAVGFKNRSHFSTAFKARYGYAPSKERRHRNE